MERAWESSVPVENIERAIKRGSGELEGARYEEITYGATRLAGWPCWWRPSPTTGTARARRSRHVFTKQGGNFGDAGSTAWMFQRKGVLLVDKDQAPDEERVLEVVLEAGADDLRDAESQ